MEIYFDIPKLLAVTAIWMTIVIVSWKVSSTSHQKVMILFIQTGLYLYSGLGLSDASVAPKYILFYALFAVGLSAGFGLGLKVFQGLTAIFQNRVDRFLNIQAPKGWAWMFIFFYIFLHLSLLVYPEFKIHMIVAPPSPDIRSWFFDRFDQSAGAFESTINYAIILATPIFYIALYKYRSNIIYMAAALLFVMYIYYVNNAYISRGVLMSNAALLFLVALFVSPKGVPRTALLGSLVIFSPVILVFMANYTQYRLGGAGGEFDIGGAFHAIAHSEFSFFKAVGEPLIESGARVDLVSYFMWIFTLPLPAAIKQSFDIALINYEISEIVLGRSAQASNWYVVLPGLLAESIYVYGERLYVLHAISIGALGALFCRISERSPHLTIMFFYVAVLMMYELNRAGISAVLPKLVNGFLLFYIISAYLMLRRFKT